MSVKQCIGRTLKGVQCRRRVDGFDYCYQHSQTIQIDDNVQDEMISWNEPERDVTNNDVSIFEHLVNHVSCYADLLSLCLSSRKFSERMTTGSFNKSVKTLIKRIYSIDISSMSHSVIAKSLGCTYIDSEYSPTPMNLFHMINRNHKTKAELFCTRSGKPVRLIVSGMEMFQANLFPGQLFITKYGPGRFVGFDQDNGFVWCLMDNDYKTKPFADEVVSNWKTIKTHEDADKVGVIILEETESLESFY